MELNPPAQYADDRNLRARQRLWTCQVPGFDIAGWVLDLAGVMTGMRVLDAGCGSFRCLGLSHQLRWLSLMSARHETGGRQLGLGWWR
ncbi:MAG TPA: hypothetical protein VHZ33_40275, partial [Trebonia sp.]|nr:hypothetical protein [Trebonia sp.]